MDNGQWNGRAFEEFWSRYPKKVGKKAARKEWEKACVTPELFEKMQQTLTWQIEQWDDPQFIPHPRTWLSQGRWDDEPVTVKPKGKSTPGQAWAAKMRAKESSS